MLNGLFDIMEIAFAVADNSRTLRHQTVMRLMFIPRADPEIWIKGTRRGEVWGGAVPLLSGFLNRLWLRCNFSTLSCHCHLFYCDKYLTHCLVHDIFKKILSLPKIRESAGCAFPWVHACVRPSRLVQSCFLVRMLYKDIY